MYYSEITSYFKTPTELIALELKKYSDENYKYFLYLENKLKSSDDKRYIRQQQINILDNTLYFIIDDIDVKKWDNYKRYLLSK